MWVWLTKVLVLVGLFLLTVVFALLPFPLVRASKKGGHRSQEVFKSVISCLTVFSAGIFLGTCLLDLFPEMREKLNGALIGVPLFGFPVAEFVMSFGFFIILITEQLILSCKESGGVIGPTSTYTSNQSMLPNSVSTNPTDGPLRAQGGVTFRDGGRPPLGETCSTENKLNTSTNANNYGLADERTALLDHRVKNGRNRSCESLSEIEDDSRNFGEFRPRSRSILSTASHLSNAFSEIDVRMRSASAIGNNDVLDKSLHVDSNSHSAIRSFMMLVALSLHSVFEGLAIGLQTNVRDTVSIFGAVVIHKCVLAFSLGLSLVNAGLSTRKVVASNLGFCIASPIGIAIGIIVDDVSSAGTLDLISGILQGLACGTFLYVTFFEVLPHEFSHSGNRILKLIFLILGFSAMVGLVFMEAALSPE